MAAGEFLARHRVFGGVCKVVGIFDLRLGRRSGERAAVLAARERAGIVAVGELDRAGEPTGDAADAALFRLQADRADVVAVAGRAAHGVARNAANVALCGRDRAGVIALGEECARDRLTDDTAGVHRAETRDRAEIRALRDLCAALEVGRDAADGHGGRADVGLVRAAGDRAEVIADHAADIALAADSARDGEVFDRAAVRGDEAETGSTGVVGADGHGVTAAVKRAGKGGVVRGFDESADGLPFNAACVNVSRERDRIALEVVILGLGCERLQLRERADAALLALELRDGLGFDGRADRAGVGHLAVGLLGRGAGDGARVPCVGLRLPLAAVRAGAAVAVGAVRCPCAEAVLVLGLRCAADVAHAVDIVVLVRRAALVIVHPLAEEHAVVRRAEDGVEIRADLLAEGVAELVRSLTAREGGLREAGVVFDARVFFGAQIVAVLEHVCVLIHAAERRGLAACGADLAHVVAVGHATLDAVGVVEIGADAARPVIGADAAEIVAVERAVGRVLADDAAGEARRTDAAEVAAALDDDAAVVAEDAGRIELGLHAAGVFAAGDAHIAAGGHADDAARVLACGGDGAVIGAVRDRSAAARNDQSAEDTADLTIAVHAAVVRAALDARAHHALSGDAAETHGVAGEGHVVFAAGDDRGGQRHVADDAAGCAVEQRIAHIVEPDVERAVGLAAGDRAAAVACDAAGIAIVDARGDLAAEGAVFDAGVGVLADDAADIVAAADDALDREVLDARRALERGKQTDLIFAALVDVEPLDAVPLPVERAGKLAVDAEREPFVGLDRVAERSHAAEVDVVFEPDGLARKAVLTGLDQVGKTPEVSGGGKLIHAALRLIVPVVGLARLFRKHNGVERDVVVSLRIMLGIRRFKAIHIEGIAVKEPVRDVGEAVGHGDGLEVALTGITVDIVAREAEFRDAERPVAQRDARVLGHLGGVIFPAAACAGIRSEVQVGDVSGVDDAGELPGLPEVFVGLLKDGLGEGVGLDRLDAGEVERLEAARLIKRGVADLLHARGQLELEDAVAQREGRQTDLLHAVGHGELQAVVRARAVEHIVRDLLESGRELDDRELLAKGARADHAGIGVAPVLNVGDRVGQLEPEELAAEEGLVAERGHGQLLARDLDARRHDEDALVADVLGQHDLGVVFDELIFPRAADGVCADALGRADGAGVLRVAVGLLFARVPGVQLGLLCAAAVVRAGAAVRRAAVGLPRAVVVLVGIRAEELVGGCLKVEHAVAVEAVVSRLTEVGAGVAQELFEPVLIQRGVDGARHRGQRRRLGRGEGRAGAALVAVGGVRGAHDARARRGHVHALAVLGARSEEVVLRQRAHADDGVIGRRVAGGAVAVVAGGGDNDHALFHGCVAGVLERLRKVVRAEAHVDDVRAVFDRVVDRAHHVADGGVVGFCQHLDGHEPDVGHDARDAELVIRVGKDHARNECAVTVVVGHGFGARFAAARVVGLDDLCGVDVLMVLAARDAVQTGVEHRDGDAAAELPLCPRCGHLQVVEVPLCAAGVERVVRGRVVEQAELVVRLAVVHGCLGQRVELRRIRGAVEPVIRRDARQPVGKARIAQLDDVALRRSGGGLVHVLRLRAKLRLGRCLRVGRVGCGGCCAGRGRAKRHERECQHQHQRDRQQGFPCSLFHTSSYIFDLHFALVYD